MAVGRIILGIISGVVAAAATVAVVEAVGHGNTQGEAAFGVAVIGYAAAALIGTATTRSIADRRAALVVPVVLAMLAAINLFSFAHPLWFAPAAIAALTLGGWMGLMVRLPRSNVNAQGEEGS